MAAESWARAARGLGACPGGGLEHVLARIGHAFGLVDVAVEDEESAVERAPAALERLAWPSAKRPLCSAAQRVAGRGGEITRIVSGVGIGTEHHAFDARVGAGARQELLLARRDGLRHPWATAAVEALPLTKVVPVATA